MYAYACVYTYVLRLCRGLIYKIFFMSSFIFFTLFSHMGEGVGIPMQEWFHPQFPRGMCSNQMLQVKLQENVVVQSSNCKLRDKVE